LNPEENIFEQALGIDSPADREAWLREACAGDERLFQSLQGLLRAHDRAGKFLDPAPQEPLDQSMGAALGAVPPRIAEKPGDRIDRYKLLEKIGEGGCGVVYMAEQEEPVRRRVALKVIKLGMDTEAVIARFEAERQALAMMDHPNIAKVLDAGATDSPRPAAGHPLPSDGKGAAGEGSAHLPAGRPYFVMELVRGTKITEFCDHNNLNTAQRLDLFMQVCRAIQHAHQKGIIHRDIKPSNILVTLHDGVPVPKVIDFGIAKATQGRLTDKTVFTAFQQFIGTPAYMSPEQAEMSGLDIDTRSDIYSLGVLLYELLTGKTPFDSQELMEAGLDGMRRTICEQEPQRPSAKLSTMVAGMLTTTANRRQTEPPKLLHAVRGDLDWIVMKALEKDRARRYETANGLATDLQRHLENEPIVARPPSNLYRFQKMVRRNKLPFVAAVAVSFSLLIGLGVSTRMYLQERAARRDQVRSRQQAQANEAKARVNESKARTEAAKSQQVAAFLEEVLNGLGTTMVSDSDRTMMRKMLDQTAEKVGFAFTNQPEVEAELRNTIGDVYFAFGDYEKAVKMHREALALYRSVLGQEHPLVAISLSSLANSLRWLGPNRGERAREAEALQREAVGMERKLFGSDSREVSSGLDNLSLLLADGTQLREAEAAAREALRIQEKLFGHEHPEVAVSLNNLALALYAQRRLNEAEGTNRAALAIRTKLLGEHPDTAKSLNNLAQVLDGEGRLEEAESLARAALTMRRKLLGADHPDVDYSAVILVGALSAQRKLSADVLRDLRSILPPDAPALATMLAAWTRNLLSKDEFVQAEALARECLAIREKKIPDDWMTFNARILVGRALLNQKRYAEAEPFIVSGYEGMKQREVKAEYLKGAVQVPVKLYDLWGQPKKAEEWRKQSAQLYSKEIEPYRELADKGDIKAINNVAWFLATCPEAQARDGARAIVLAQKAVSATERTNAHYLNTLAAAYAECGELAKAVSTQKEAVALGDERQKEELLNRLRLYESNTRRVP
jgi:serine/threonine protein kinase